jgi:hypothetical protein
VTPSAWNASATAIEQKNGVAWYSFGVAANSTSITNAFVNSGGSFIYKTSDFASSYQQISGQHIWRTAPSGTAGNAISWTEAMRLDASGNLGLGVTPSAQGVYRTMQFGNYTTIGQQTTGTAQSFFGWNVRGSSTANQYLYNVTADKAALYEIYSDASHRWFVTNTSGTAGNAISFTEAMRLDASGVLSVGTALAENSTGVYALPTGELRVKDNTENGTSQISIYNTNITSDLEQFFVAMNLDDVDLGNRRTDGGDLKLFTLNTERARITSDGTFRVAGAGTAGSTDALQISGSAPASSMVLNSSGVLTLGSALPVASGGTGSTSTTYCSLTTNVTGTLPVANGGTGANNLTGVVKGNGTSAFTAGSVNLASEVTGTLPVANGGTGATTSTGTGAVVLSNSPTLVTPVLGTPTSGNFSSGSFTWPTFNQNTTGTASNVTGTVAVANGGTGLTSFTSGGVVYASSTSALATSSGLVFDGTNFATTGTASATKLVPTGSVTAGNGMYLPAADTLAWSTGGVERARMSNKGLTSVSSTFDWTTNGAWANGAFTGTSISGVPSTSGWSIDMTNAIFLRIGTASVTGVPTECMRITSSGNVVAGGSVALATTATDGFLYVPTCAGTPTGTPTAITGMAPIVVNTTNNKLYFYSGGAWRDAGP